MKTILTLGLILAMTPAMAQIDITTDTTPTAFESYSWTVTTNGESFLFNSVPVKEVEYNLFFLKPRFGHEFLWGTRLSDQATTLGYGVYGKYVFDVFGSGDGFAKIGIAALLTVGDTPGARMNFSFGVKF